MQGPRTYTGVSFACSTVRLAEITDGTSNTIMVGEKFLNPKKWIDGSDPSDNENLYTGFDNDHYRSTGRRIFPTAGRQPESRQPADLRQRSARYSTLFWSMDRCAALATTSIRRHLPIWATIAAVLAPVNEVGDGSECGTVNRYAGAARAPVGRLRRRCRARSR